LFKIADSVKKITYNRKNLSDILEAIIGSIFLQSTTLHEIHYFLEQKLELYGANYKNFYKKVIEKNPKKKTEYLKIFCADHKNFLDWISHSHPDKYQNLSTPYSEIAKIFYSAQKIQNLSKNPFSSNVHQINNN
jgi:hypothetical protein